MVKTTDKETKILWPDITKENISIQLRGWGIADHVPDYITNKRGVILTQKTDTMQLLCFCALTYNYYFKDVKFKKGTYLIQVNHIDLFYRQNIYEAKGKKLSIPKSFKKIVFKSTLTRDSIVGYGQSNLLLKDIYFNVMDFSDTVNIKLIPIDVKDFFNDNFKPNTNY